MVGALGFEPRSAGFFRLACTWIAHALGLRQVGAPVGHQIHQNTSSSSFPCNWSPRYYQVILYPQGWTRERFPAYDGLGRPMCHSDDANGPREMLSMVHTPIMEIAMPHALGLSPTLISPMMEEYCPKISGTDRSTVAAIPAVTP